MLLIFLLTRSVIVKNKILQFVTYLFLNNNIILFFSNRTYNQKQSITNLICIELVR